MLVALKIPMGPYREDEAFRRRFHREVDVAQRVDHPNAVRTFDHGSLAGQPYSAMEFVEGVALDTLIEEGAPSILRSSPTSPCRSWMPSPRFTRPGWCVGTRNRATS